MKKAISFVIMDYPFIIFGPYSVFISVFAGDGSVAISHGGIECGQGINTKVFVKTTAVKRVCIKNNTPNGFNINKKIIT